MKKYFLIYFFIHTSTLCFGQYDTLTYKDVKILESNKKKSILYKDKLFSGYLKHIQEDNSYCYEFIKNGKSISLKCEKVKKAKERLEKYKTVLNKYSIEDSRLLNELNKCRIPIGDQNCIECDYPDHYYIYNEKDKTYNGYAKLNDTLFFIFEGEIKFKKTFYSKNSVDEYVEFIKDKKFGKYKKYAKNGSLLIEGDYLNNKKYGKWKIYNSNDYDIIVENYLQGNVGLVFFYKNNDLVRCEFYENNQLDYYYVAEVKKNKETRKFYRNGKNYAIEKLIDGHIDEYIEIKE